MILAIAAHLLISAPSEAPTSISQGASRIIRKVAERDVEIEWPSRDPKFEPARRASVGAVSVHGGYRGEVLDASTTDSAWLAIAADPVLRSLPPTPLAAWRVKVFAIVRADILNIGDSLRPRRGMLDKAEIEFLYQSLARASAAIESKTRGRIRPVFDLELDGAEDFEDCTPGSEPFGAAWLEDYVSPRINGIDFQADDKVYRGPWSSVWVVHPGLVDRFPSVSIKGMPCAAIPYFATRKFGRDADLAEALVLAWERGFVEAGRAAGFQLASSKWTVPKFTLGNGFPESWVGTVSPTIEPTWQEISARANVRRSLEGMSWPGPGSDPSALVGPMTREEVAIVAGGDLKWNVRDNGLFISSPAHAVPMMLPSNSLDGVFEFGQEASALVRLSARSLWFVDARFGHLIGPAGIQGLKAHGTLDVEGTACYVLTLPTPAADMTEWQLFGLPNMPIAERASPSTAGQMLFNGLVGGLRCIGTFKAEASKDQSRVSVDVRLGFPHRLGSAVLYDGFADNTYVDAKQTPIFKLWLKSTTIEPLRMRFESDSAGWPSPTVRFFGRWPTPEDAEPTPGFEIPVPADGRWHEVEVDVRGLSAAKSSMRIRRISLESDPLAAFWGSDAVGTATVTVGSLSCSSTADPVPTYGLLPLPEARVDSDSKDARARWAFSAGPEDAGTLIGLLKDRYTLVRINAAAALRKCKGTNVEAALADSLNTLDPRLAQQSMLALKAQGTQYAWDQIVRFFNGPPADAHRLFALEALTDRKDARSAGSLTAAFASPSWRTRRAGAMAIAEIGTPDANTLLMVFLQESNPSVRLAVVNRADMSLEKVCRRILYTAVNDSSESVRAASLVKLIGSPTKAFRDEGFKGVRDESRFVRIAVLDHLAAHPSEESRQALQIAVVDEHALVKCAALRAWTKIPGDVRREELGDVFDSSDPRVKVALEDLLKARTIR